MKEQLKRLKQEFQTALEQAGDSKTLEELKVAYLGKKGRLSGLMAELKSIPPQDKAAAGKGINDLKQSLQAGLEAKTKAFAQAEQARALDAEWIDVTLNPADRGLGAFHPVSLIQRRLEGLFTAMGFQILDGPHIETEHYNFEALNIPAHHPARDMQDTFYFTDGHLLRTQTSTIQIRGMEYLKPPLRIIASGKVFRCERADASHDSCFHQIEGMMVDEDISVAHLIYFMKTMLTEIFEKEVKVRLRPGYFPFVEPGFELEISCLICDGKGCSVCKRVGWLELLGCGMVHPSVLRSGGIDPQRYSGFAFGVGLDRLAMMKYAISDIRELHNGGLGFMRDFTLPADLAFRR